MMKQHILICNMCDDWTTTNEKQLQNHVINKHKFKCTVKLKLDNWCDWIGDTQEDLDKHIMEKHPFKCPFCEERFEKKQWAKYHRRVHLHWCAFCNMKFVHENMLQDHVAKEHANMEPEETSQNCRLCRRKFPSIGMLRGHLYTHHSKDKDVIKCDQCNKLFNSEPGLKQHKKQGSGFCNKKKGKKFRLSLRARQLKNKIANQAKKGHHG